jgi:hypothetical protein
MSKIVELLSDGLPSLLNERLVDLFGERHSTEPPRYEYGPFVMEAVPVPEHIQSALPASIATAVDTCLVLPERVILDWSTGHLEPAVQSSLQDLISVIVNGRRWAVVLESATGVGRVTIGCAPADLFASVARELRFDRASLAVFLQGSDENPYCPKTHATCLRSPR